MHFHYLACHFKAVCIGLANQFYLTCSPCAVELFFSELFFSELFFDGVPSLQGTVLLKSASELLDFNRGEEHLIEEVRATNSEQQKAR